MYFERPQYTGLLCLKRLKKQINKSEKEKEKEKEKETQELVNYLIDILLSSKDVLQIFLHKFLSLFFLKKKTKTKKN